MYSSYLEIVEGRLIQDGIDRLEQQGVTDIIVVPLFASSGSVHIDEIRYALGLQAEPTLPTDLPRMRFTAKMHWTKVMDDHPLIIDVLMDKLRSLSESPDREVLVVTGHGSREDGFYERWREVMERIADKLRIAGGFCAAEAALLLPDETASVMNRLQLDYADHDVLIVPFSLVKDTLRGRSFLSDSPLIDTDTMGKRCFHMRESPRGSASKYGRRYQGCGRKCKKAQRCALLPTGTAFAYVP